MATNETIAKRLRELRGDLAREAVAYACKISSSALAMYETGKRVPRDEVKVRLADFYKTTVQAIFFN